MSKSTFTLDPSPVLFDVRTGSGGQLASRVERVALEHIELAANPRREITDEGIDRLAKMLCSSGQLVPCIGWRPDPDQPTVILYDGQRRYLAARAGHRDGDRIAAVCADLGISPKRAHNLRRQLTLPEQIRTRVAERPAGEQISVTMANKLADMHEIAPQLTEAVAKRITTGDLHDKAIRDLGAFVHRTVVEDEHTYAVRIDDGALLDAAEQIDHARPHLNDDGRRQVAAILGCEADRLDRELDALAARAKARALKLRITGEVRDRARNGRYAYVHDRGQDFAAGIWIIDPAFMLDLAHQQLGEEDSAPAREEAYFAGARLRDDELRDAAAEDEQRRAQARARHAEATRSNLGLGHDIRAALIQPTDQQLSAVRDIICRLLVRHYGEPIAYGAGWTDPERQQPVGDTGRHEPRQLDVIADAELQRAVADPDPLHGIAQLAARLGAAFTLNPAGVTRTKVLGTDRMARKLGDALPGGEGALRASVWELMRPMLSPALVTLNRDAFVTQDDCETTVDLAGRHGASSLDDLDLDELNSEAA